MLAPYRYHSLLKQVHLLELDLYNADPMEARTERRKAEDYNGSFHLNIAIVLSWFW